MSKKERFSKKRVIERLLSKAESINWPHQMKVMKELLLQYPDEDFWNKVNFNLDITSLEYFKSIGRDILNKKYIEFHYIIDNSNKKEYILSNQKFGDKPNIEFKPKNLREFINNGKN
jgi:hypothetical protein